MECPKSPPLRDPAYRRSAQGRMCDVPGCEAMGIEGRVVLAHIRLPENSGIGMKPPDSHSLFLCQTHHDQLDGRGDAWPLDRCMWIVRNIVLPLREENHRLWTLERKR